MARFNIDKPAVETAVRALAEANNISLEQMAAWIGRNLYEARTHRRISERIHYHSVAITNIVADEL